MFLGNLCFIIVYFINCKGFETIDLSENQLDGCNLIGISLSEDILKENSNSVIDLIIEAETFKDRIFGKQDLRNCLYHKCSFIDCNFDNDINLDYSVDFNEYYTLFKDERKSYPTIISNILDFEIHFKTITAYHILITIRFLSFFRTVCHLHYYYMHIL